MRRRPWHYATSYGPGHHDLGPDGCLWCVQICRADRLCPCCRSRWVRVKRRAALVFVVPVVRLRWRLDRSEA